MVGPWRGPALARPFFNRATRKVLFEPVSFGNRVFTLGLGLFRRARGFGLGPEKISIGLGLRSDFSGFGLGPEKFFYRTRALDSGLKFFIGLKLEVEFPLGL